MSKAVEKTSCLKKLGCGCAVILIAFGGLAAVVGIGVVVNKPSPPDLTTVTMDTADGGLELPRFGSDAEPSKPVRVVMDIEFAKFQLKPGRGDQQNFETTGDYDQANFELKTDLVDKGDYLEYRVTFDNKNALIGLFAEKGHVDDSDINRNKLVVTLPTNVLLDLDIEMKMGRADLDISGLAVQNLDFEMRMGGFNLVSAEANQVSMEELNFDTSMSEGSLMGIENLNLKKGNFKTRMGELAVYNTGSMHTPADLNFKVTMGEARVELPENIELDASGTAVLGEVRLPRDRDGDPGRPKAKVRGEAKMGSFAVSLRTRGKPIDQLILPVLQERSLNAAVELYQQTRREFPDKYNYAPDALNELGYRLLRAGDHNAAIEVFRLNTITNPDYANGWDSLGEGYYRTGQYQKAKENYLIAIEKNPNNRNAMVYLDEIERRLGNGDPNEQVPAEEEEPEQ